MAKKFLQKYGLSRFQLGLDTKTKTGGSLWATLPVLPYFKLGRIKMKVLKKEILSEVVVGNWGIKIFGNYGGKSMPSFSNERYLAKKHPSNKFQVKSCKKEPGG
ncbi:MAG: hypothetical protein ACKVU0_07785 [Saprospiraceae bacterium]